MRGLRDLAMRSVVPTLAATLFDGVWAEATKVVHRTRGISLGAEFFFAFDDPYSALVFQPVVDLCRRHRVALELYPVLSRGVVGDPDDHLRRNYAVLDARRLAGDFGTVICRETPLSRDRVADVTAWAEAARDRGALESFAADCLARLWQSQVAPDYGELYAVYHHTVGSPPPKADIQLRARVRHNDERLHQGHWDTPSVKIGGRWFFAHDRFESLESWLGELAS